MSSLPADPYKALGVSKDAQIPEIRSAHRKLVLKCHPDKVQDPELKAQKQDEFQKVQQAYELLSDEKERQKYDDQVKLAELRKQFQNKANISSPRASPKYADFEVYTAEPRASTFKTSTQHAPPGAKMYFTATTRSYDEDRPNVTEIRTSRRGTTTYSEKPSKRESERDRERDRDYREREKELRERDRRRRADDDARQEKAAKEAAKEARHAEKRRLEKQRDKERKRATEEKRRPNAYISPYEDDQPAKEKKKSSSSRKHEEKRERSSHREEVHAMPHAMHPPPMPQVPTMPVSHDRAAHNFDIAASYIHRAKQPAAPSMPPRSATYHVGRNSAPPVPTPPPVGSPFAAPTVAEDSDEQVHRSSAPGKVRRGSSDTIKSAKAHKKSREFSEEPPHIVDASPTPRHTAAFQKSTSAAPMMSSSPPRQNINRTNSMPIDQSHARPAGPGVARAATFNTYTDSADPRGRGRSRLQPQISEEIEDSEEEYEPQPRRQDRKHRASKKTRSPEPYHRSSETKRYAVGGDGRTKLQNAAYSRPLEQPDDAYYYQEVRPPMPSRDAYSSSGAAFPKVRQSKNYDYGDVRYSDHHYGQQSYRDEYPAAYA